MGKRTALAMGIALSVLAAGSAFAQNQPASKATAQVADIHVLHTEGNNSFSGFTTILSNSLRTSEQKDLFVAVSMECGLYTRTLVRSKSGISDTALAEAGIEVRVLIDGEEAEPGPVTFCRRSQELSATFQGLIDGCLSVDDSGNVVLDQDCLRPEEVQLVLNTMNANAYNFVAGDLSSGVHRVEVQARVDLGSQIQQGQAEARATIGKGSVTVESVRMVRGEDIELY